jgi:hypothetical protein
MFSLARPAITAVRRQGPQGIPTYLLKSQRQVIIIWSRISDPEVVQVGYVQESHLRQIQRPLFLN